MKKNILRATLTIMTISLISISSSPKISSMEYEDSWDYYKFFQFVEAHDDGAHERWTGCATLGGSCWSDGPGVSADCMMRGTTTWRPCNGV